MEGEEKRKGQGREGKGKEGAGSAPPSESLAPITIFLAPALPPSMGSGHY